MAAYAFERLSSGTVKVTAGTNVFFIMGAVKIDPNDDAERIVITSVFGDKLTIDLSDGMDTVTGESGTPTEIAEVLATDIFFLASGGAGGLVADADNKFTNGQTVYLNTDPGTIPDHIAFRGDNNAGQGQFRASNGVNYWDFGRDNDIDGSFVIFNGAAWPLKITPGTLKWILGAGVHALEYADNAAAKTGGEVNGTLYRTGDALKIVHA